MPSLSTLYRLYGRDTTDGYAKKKESDMVMNETWWDDINAKYGYLYDYDHDSYKTQLSGFTPASDSNKTRIDVKQIVHTQQTFSKDIVTQHIQLRPGQTTNVDYYDTVFKNRYGARFPIGLYIDLPDADGIYNRWLVVAEANSNDPQFPTFEILRCDYVVQYIFNGIKYNVPSVLRSQNSYNSGLWTDRVTTTVEDQQKFIVPLNRDTENIYYNQRMIIDASVITEPRAWKVSKVNRISAAGICHVTLAQDHYDEHKDYIEVDTSGNVVGMWADYYQSPVTPVDPSPTPSGINAKISYTGKAPDLKIGGGTKKYTIHFYSGETETQVQAGTWSFKIGTTDAASLVSQTIDGATNKVKFIGGDAYLDKVLTIKYTTSDNIVATLDVPLVAL